MSVYCSNTLVGTSLQQLTSDHFLNCEHDTIFAPNANGGSTIFYGFDRIFDLEVASIGREDRVGEIVTRTYRSLWKVSFGLAVKL